MKKILYVCDTLMKRSGVTSVFMSYLKNFEYKKITIEVLIYEDSECDVVDEIKEMGINVHYIPHLSVNNISSFLSRIKCFFKNNKYEIVHSHCCQIDMIIMHYAHKYNDCVYIAHSHNTKLSEYPLRAFRNWFFCFPVRFYADKWAACSMCAGKALFGKRFSNSEKSLLIHNAIECDKFKYDIKIRSALRNEMNLDDVIVLGTIGSIKPQKNPLFLIAIFNELLKQSIDNKRKYRLLVVGDGELRNDMEEKAKELQIYDYCIFTGVRKDIERVLQVIDVLLMPSLYEGLPVTAIEAQASGVACLLSDNITRECAINDNVKYLPINDSGIWVSSIVEEDVKRENDGYLNMKKNGYDIKTEAVKIENYYNEIELKRK